MVHQHQSSLSDDAWKYCSYLSFKMDCAREQEEIRWSFLREKAQGHFNELAVAQEAKTVELAKAMPKKALTRVVCMPKVMTKKDGSASANSVKWYHLLKSENMPKDTVGPITVVTGYEDGNPNSPQQVKQWLYSLGWVPCTFKFSRDADGEQKTIEQIRYLKGHDREGELCDSVTRLAKEDPAVTVLEGLTVLTHRLGFFKSMLENCVVDADGSTWLRAEVGGLTNTLRFKHKKPLANLPAVGKSWGQEIRDCLVVPNDAEDVLCGFDVISLEDTTKRHLMQPYDPAYVAEMQTEGFDPHMRLLVIAGKITEDDYEFYTQWGK